MRCEGKGGNVTSPFVIRGVTGFSDSSGERQETIAVGREATVLGKQSECLFPRILTSEVESSRTSLASRTHFEVLGLKASSPWPWPRNLRSSKISLSSARGQHYF